MRQTVKTISKKLKTKGKKLKLNKNLRAIIMKRTKSKATTTKLIKRILLVRIVKILITRKVLEVLKILTMRILKEGIIILGTITKVIQTI